MNKLIKKLHELLSKRREEIESEPMPAQAVFSMLMGQYEAVFHGAAPLDTWAEAFCRSKNDTEKQIYAVCQQILAIMPSEAKSDRIAKLKAEIERLEADK